MELDYALLADSAQVAEGKTFVLGGGVTILWRNQYPAPLGVSLVAYLRYHLSEADTNHVLRVQVVDADGNQIVPEIHGEFHLGEPGPDLPAGLALGLPVVIPFPPLPAVQKPGAYSVEILVDDRHVKSVPFAVAHPPSHSHSH